MSSDEDPPVAPADGTPGSPNMKHERICKVRGRTDASRAKKNTNALSQDRKLKDLLATADEIQSLDHFNYWKDEFLESFRTYLDKEGTATAREADDELFVHMQKLAITCLTVKELCATGGISEEASTVKGRNALNEMVALMATNEQKIKVYWPKTQEDEERAGYSKYELGAVLVRDGFRVYEIMVSTRDYIIVLRDGPLKGGLLTPNSRSIMGFYLKEIDSFCDTMADLGLYKLMNKCLELYKIRPRTKKKKIFNRAKGDPLSDTSDEDLINKGRMFRRSKVKFRAIMDKGWSNGLNGQEVHNPHAGPEGSKDVTQVTKRGAGDEPNPKDANEWIYYFDPVSEKIGKVARKKCLQENFLIRHGEDGQEHQDSAVKEWDGEEGKSKLIWTLKDALKGKTKKLTEGKQ